MSNVHQDPSVDEILASIRRIIAEEELSVAPVVTHKAAPAGEGGPLILADEDVLELTDRVPDPMDTAEAPQMAGLEAAAPPEPAEPAARPAVELAAQHAADPLETGEALVMSELDTQPAPTPAPVPALDEPLVGPRAASSVASSFDALERSVQMPAADRTLEDVVSALLRPMLKAWLDENLPAIVEAKVAAEVDRIVRQRR